MKTPSKSTYLIISPEGRVLAEDKNVGKVIDTLSGIARSGGVVSQHRLVRAAEVPFQETTGVSVVRQVRARKPKDQPTQIVPENAPEPVAE